MILFMQQSIGDLPETAWLMEMAVWGWELRCGGTRQSQEWGNTQDFLMPKQKTPKKKTHREKKQGALKELDKVRHSGTQGA